jgi:aminoglycoside phosphotransferase family enzyme/predicted kinase
MALSSDGRLLAFLRDPASYEPRPARVELVETHISYVALAGAHVYKVARSVKFPFADFSTLEQRRVHAYRALELNPRLCPDVYLDVLPIIEHEGRLAFAEASQPTAQVAAYALRMRRLPEEGFLDWRLRAGGVTRAEWDRLVATLAAFYREQPIREAISRDARPEVLRAEVFENLDLLAQQGGAIVSPGAAVALRHYNRRYFEWGSPVLEQRVAQGWIRDGHGDLRPEHVHLSEDRVRFFDCVEFNDRLRHLDVAADFAFLTMELDCVGRAAESRRLCAAFADALDDSGQSRVMDFYKCYRACVRGKVALLAMSDPHAAPSVAESKRRAARDYYRLGLRYAVAGSQPMLLAVMGRVATGKTTLADALAQHLGWEAYHSDALRKQLAGLPISERPPEPVRRRLYRPAMTERTYGHMLHLAEQRLRAGDSVILDATFADRRRRAGLRRCAQAGGAHSCLVELHAPDELILRRLGERQRDAGAVSDARQEDFAKLKHAYQSPLETPADELIRLSAEKPELQVLEDALCALADRNVARTLDAPGALTM